LKDDPLPDWPTPAGEPIGGDRARAYIAGIRQHASPSLREARQMIHARYPGAPLEQSSVRVQELATWHGPTPQMAGLAIGTVAASVSGGTWAMDAAWRSARPGASAWALLPKDGKRSSTSWTSIGGSPHSNITGRIGSCSARSPIPCSPNGPPSRAVRWPSSDGWRLERLRGSWG
jgi:hypothetical protein